MATDEVSGWRIDCVLPDRDYDRITVKLPESAKIPDALVGKSVSFDGLAIHAYAIRGRGLVTASANSVKVLG